MQNITQAVGSLKYVRVQVTVTKAGVPYNPTVDAVSMAFLPDGTDPTAGDFKTGIWETDATGPNPIYNGMCLVGPGGTIALAKGLWVIFTKVGDNPEIPAEPVGTLTIT